MTILDLVVGILILGGIILLVYAVGRVLYSAPGLPQDWIPGMGYRRHWSRPNTKGSCIPHWLGGRDSEPKPSAVDHLSTNVPATGIVRL
jgi:hypothetical protein